MNAKTLMGLILASFMTACGGAAVGEECKTDADCADGLHCEMHAHEDEEGEEEGEAHEGEEEHGTCVDEHDHDDHEGEDHDDE